MSNLLHHSSTSQFRRRFHFGSVARDTARANTGQHSTRRMSIVELPSPDVVAEDPLSTSLPSLAGASLDTA